MPIYITRYVLCIAMCTGAISATPYKRSSTRNRNALTTCQRRYTHGQQRITPTPHQRRSRAQSLHEQSLQYTSEDAVNEAENTMKGIIEELARIQQICNAPWQDAYNQNQSSVSSDKTFREQPQGDAQRAGFQRPSDIVYTHPITANAPTLPSARELINRTAGDTNSTMKTIQAVPSILLERNEISLPHLNNLDLYFYAELVRTNTKP